MKGWTLVFQRCNHWEIFGATSAMQWWGRINPPGWNRVKVSENLGATAVTPVVLKY